MNPKKNARTTKDYVVPKKSTKSSSEPKEEKAGMNKPAKNPATKASKKASALPVDGKVHTIKSAPVSQAGKARMGRPASPQLHAAYAEETKQLMTAIKVGSGNLSNRKIEEGLGIGREKTGTYSGRYFSRYLNVDGAAVKAALPPDRLSQIAEKARGLGWLPAVSKNHGINTPDKFKHLEVADGELLSERIQLMMSERERLLDAKVDALKALEHLQATMKSCTLIGFMYAANESDGESDVMFDGININIKKVIERIGEAFVFNEEFLGSSILNELASRPRLKDTLDAKAKAKAAAKGKAKRKGKDQDKV